MSLQGCTILIADDDEFIREDLRELLAKEKPTLLFSSTGEETRKIVREKTPDLVLLDIGFPDSNDLGVLKEIRKTSPDTEVLILSGQTENISQIVDAIQGGAYDFVPKPFVDSELINRLQKALELRNLKKAQDVYLKELQSLSGVDQFVGNSAGMKHAKETIRKLADSDGCVLIRGESGTGKELAARALHYTGNRRTAPFVVVNCAAIPESLVESTLFGHRRGSFTGAVESAKGKFEAAGNGTIFLDEIGDMPLAQQASLLRVLEYRKFTPVGESQERECKARFVLATNRDLRESVKRGEFREDLFYRINVAGIVMPPLRTRPEDIPEVVEYYCQKLCAEMGRLPLAVESDVLGLFEKYDWPGNVRELKNILEAAVMLGDASQRVITLRDLPPELLAVRSEENSDGKQMDAAELREKQDLLKALKESNGNQTQAAKILGCHRNTVRARIRYYGISDYLIRED